MSNETEIKDNGAERGQEETVVVPVIPESPQGAIEKDSKAEETENENGLTPKQETFCQLYVKNSELFGNGTLAYAQAYGYDLDSMDRVCKTDENLAYIKGTSEYDMAFKVCAVCASQTLRKPKVNERVTKLLNELMTDEYVDSQLAKVVAQDYKLDAKVAAIREYNKLKARIIEKIDHTTAGLPIGVVILPQKQNGDIMEAPKETSDSA